MWCFARDGGTHTRSLWETRQPLEKHASVRDSSLSEATLLNRNELIRLLPVMHADIYQGRTDALYDANRWLNSLVLTRLRKQLRELDCAFDRRST